jgi:acylphosphatase
MKKRIVIKGERVQDVGYRLFLLEAAEQLGLVGFQAKNMEDYVECIVEGEKSRVDKFIEFARSNFPEFAEVREVIDENYEGSVMSIEGFYRIFSLSQLVKIVNVGLKMLEKQDETLKEIKELRTDLKTLSKDSQK